MRGYRQENITHNPLPNTNKCEFVNCLTLSIHTFYGKNSLVRMVFVWQELTGKDGLSHALFSHVSVGLAFLSERSLKHKLGDVVLSLKLGLALIQVLGQEVRLHVCDLDVSMLQVQGTHADLPMNKKTLKMSYL